MTLAELINALEAADPNHVVRHGFTNPHSYRGDYVDLAFEPATDVTVADMLTDARNALGATYQGWKGGDFTMSDSTECWLSEEGRASGDTISALLVELMLTSTTTDNAAADQQTARANAATPGSWGIYEYGTDGSVTDITAEVRHQRTELAATGMLAPQQCPAGLHADWLVDSEYAHACPWCQIDRLRTDAAAELMPVWEAVYEPGNVSDYLIGYMNDQDAATGAAEAWMRSQAEVTGRLEWVPWGDATPMPDGYDRWFELGQQHDDGIDTGSGIVVRRRKEPAPEAVTAPLAASQPSEAPVEGETAARPPTERLGDSGPDAARIALTRSDLAALLAHHADVLAAQLRTDVGRDAWIAAERLTEHANDLSAEVKRPTVTELLDNIWTFPLEQQAKARCGHDIETALGTYPCERDADHDGDCDERTEVEYAAALRAHHTQENPR